MDGLIDLTFFEEAEFATPSRFMKQQPEPEMPQLAAFYLGSKTPDEIKQLNRSDLLTPNLVAESEFRGKTGQNYIGESPRVYYDSRADMLLELSHLDKQEYKWNLTEYGMTIDDASPQKVLSACREIRNSFPSGNLISKRAFTEGPGTAAHKFDFGLKELGIFFGVDGPHSSAYRGKLVKFCVGQPKIENWFFRRGELADWKMIMPPDVRLIYSNVNGYGEFGLEKSREIIKIHQDIISEGYTLVYKHHLEQPLIGEVLAWKKPRPHNMEVVLVVRKGPTGGVDLQGLLEKVKRVNLERTRMMLTRTYRFKFPTNVVVGGMAMVYNESSGLGLLVKKKKMETVLRICITPLVN